MVVLLAGGTGLIGKELEVSLIDAGHTVYNLSRNPQKNNHYYWSVEEEIIEFPFLNNVEVIINLSGESLTQRWTKACKVRLYNSRVKSTEFLYSLAEKMPKLRHFITASGVTCYGFDTQSVHKESDPFGDDYLSYLVKEWEEAADLFSKIVLVSKVRIGVVLSPNGGALDKMVPVVKLCLGSGIGSGQQLLPWIHSSDLCQIFSHLITKQSFGTFNACADCTSNDLFMHSIAKVLNKPYFMPNVPSFVLKLLYGEMAILLLKGVKVSNDKLLQDGFKFSFNTLDKALDNCLI